MKKLLKRYVTWAEKLFRSQEFTLVINLLTLLSVWLIYIMHK